MRVRLADFTCLVIAVLLAFWFSGEQSTLPVFAIPSAIIMAISIQGWRPTHLHRWNLLELALARLWPVVPVSCAALALTYLIGPAITTQLAIWLGATIPGLCLARCLTYYLVLHATGGAGPEHRVALVPASTLALRMRNKHSKYPGESGVAVTGVFSEYGSLEQQQTHSSISGSMTDLRDHIVHGHVDEVTIVPDKLADNRLEMIKSIVGRLPVNVSAAFPADSDIAKEQHGEIKLGDRQLIPLHRIRLDEGQMLLKQIADMVMASVMLIVLAPLILTIALLIKMSSPGPVFFRQQRVGLFQREFSIWKFRTLKVDETDHLSLSQAHLDDPRITPVGRFLRKTSLDELPQLFNVMLGEMSLVGPRPHAPMTQVGGLPIGKTMADYDSRHCVKPGLTGLAQIHGCRGPVDDLQSLEKRVAYDQIYIRTWSFLLDASILLRTLGVPFNIGASSNDDMLPGPAIGK